MKHAGKVAPFDTGKALATSFRGESIPSQSLRDNVKNFMRKLSFEDG